MGWNNRNEIRMFLREQDALEKRYRKSGMSDEQINEIQKYDRRVFLNRRNHMRLGEEIPLSKTDDKGNETIAGISELLYYDETMKDPFVYGFEDERLNIIWCSLDKGLDKKIFFLLSKGLSQTKIGEMIGVSQSTVSYRILKFKK